MSTSNDHSLPGIEFEKLRSLTLLAGRQEGHPACKKTERWGAGVVICLERRADLHMAQLMPLPLTVSCFSKIQIGSTFLVEAHPGSPGQRVVKRVCVCVCVCRRRTSRTRVKPWLARTVTRSDQPRASQQQVIGPWGGEMIIPRQVELSVGRPPDLSWKRPPCRPRAKWTDQLRRDDNFYSVPIATLWRQAIGRGHSRATLRSEPTTR